MEGNYKEGQISLGVTIVLGVMFRAIQLGEYMEVSFTIADSAYGRTFFVITGFHGLHVIIGTLFLIVGAGRLRGGHFNSQHHFGFEAAA